MSIEVSPSQAEALVLFEWLHRFNSSSTKTFADQAEERVLWDLESVLESKVDAVVSLDYREQLESARAHVRDSFQ